jgi:4-amino-4-deoxy-L-arabinose transferase-like glycosyltransferase
MSRFPFKQWGDAVALTLVIGCFCAPLFLELGGRDLRNDEAIYAYAIERIVETGDWLTPRAIPFDGPFLEKPPLKFWMVAAPIALGLLPPDEFGLRLVDACLATLAFLYVFLLGRWLADAVGGVAAVLVLFAFEPLVFEHGLRSNNMEALLVLCYAGGVYHAARWIDGGGGGPAARHRWPVAVYFAAGFLAKFVAILFLPIIVLAALLMRRDGWHTIRSTWRAWLGPAALVVGLSAPWFVYQALATGRHVWAVMFGQHIYTRFTGALDVQHLQPWHYYAVTLWLQLQEAGSGWIAIGGGAALVIAASRRDGWLARLFLCWTIVPVALMSLGSSKLFHYAYPFLAPIALGAGYGASLAFNAAADLLVAVIAPVRQRLPAPLDSPHPAVRAAGWALTVAAGLAALTGLITAMLGGLSWEIADATVFRNNSVIRPFLIAAAFLYAAGQVRWAARSLAAIILVALLPVAAYSKRLEQAAVINRPLRAARDCITGVRRPAGEEAGLYNAAPALTYHAYSYYFRDLEPWLRVERPDPAELQRRLTLPGHQTPVLISDADYRDLALAITEDEIAADAGAPLVGFSADAGLVVLLPGPYAVCAHRAAAAGGKPVGFAAGWGTAR